MSTGDNKHFKGLQTNALKTNFISNTTQKLKPQQQKRFSNISKQKQTIQKNQTRYYEQTNLQDSATILPQKNTSRNNIYVNQNLPTNQRKETLGIKAKSPIDKNRLTIGETGQLQIKTQQPQLKVSSKIVVESERDRSLKSLRNKEDVQPQVKMKSMVFNKKLGPEIDDLMCDEQMDLVPQNQPKQRKLSQNLNNRPLKPQSKKQQDPVTLQAQLIQPNRTQKKPHADKPTLLLQKVKSQHTIIYKPEQPAKPQSYSNLPEPSSYQPFSARQRNQQTSMVGQFQEELRKFSQIQNELNMGCEIETIYRLENRQKSYLAEPNYIETRQRNFTWFMRAVLVDWMMQVCFEFGLKRQTYHIAVTLADNYLEKTLDLPRAQFQLVGAAAMFIAAKLEEFDALPSCDFSKSTDNRYTPQQIRQTQLKICRTLGYQLNPPTLYMWANRFMAHWDNYIDLTNARFHPYFQNHSHKYFKKEFQESYLLFRELMQMIDCSILQVQTLQFAPKILVCSFMYLVLGKSYKEWSAKRIVEQFPRSSHYLVSQEEEHAFNSLFHQFIFESFSLDIIELLPAVQYCSTFFTLPLNFQPPSYALKNNDLDESAMVLEEYESFQTYNNKMIDLVKKRYRGVQGMLIWSFDSRKFSLQISLRKVS